MHSYTPRHARPRKRHPVERADAIALANLIITALVAFGVISPPAAQPVAPARETYCVAVSAPCSVTVNQGLSP